MGDDTEHARFSPSGINILINCNGSQTLPKHQYGENTFAEHGTKAHELCEKIGKHQSYTEADYTWDGEIDLEMLDCAKWYAKFIHSFENPEHLAFEERLKYDDDLWGTSDCILIKDGVLWVIDYKHGFVPVEADSSQLKTYAFMAYDRYKDKFDIKSISTVIIQPRIDPEPKIAEHSIEDIKKFENKVLSIINDLNSGNHVFKAGGHCTYCKSKLSCPEMKRIKEDVGKSPQIMEPEELSRVLGELNGLEEYIKEVRKYSYAQAMDGVQIPKFKLVERVTHRKWASHVDEKKLLKYLKKDQMYKKPVMITAPQALKLNKDIPESFIIKPVGEPALVPKTDKRAEIVSEDSMDRLADLLSQ